MTQLWQHIAGKRGVGHCLHINRVTFQLAVTDDSLRDANNPGSVDGGLLLVDREQPIEVSVEGVRIPVIATSRPHAGSFVTGSLVTDLPLAVVCHNHGYTVTVTAGVERLAAQLARLTGGEANPVVYLDPQTRVFSMPAAANNQH